MHLLYSQLAVTFVLPLGSQGAESGVGSATNWSSGGWIVSTLPLHSLTNTLLAGNSRVNASGFLLEWGTEKDAPCWASKGSAGTGATKKERGDRSKRGKSPA